METSFDGSKNIQVRTYNRENSIVFLKTKEAFGGLSNMAGSFPLCVNGIHILTSEALYQACRFPHLPEVQRLIIGENSPMTAKMKSKSYRKDSRRDWVQVRIKIMRWCLRVKLAQNWEKFGALLLSTDDMSIVEQSHKDDFWGAKPIDERTLVGMNVLGRLLMGLRESIKAEQRELSLQVEPLYINNFLLNDKPITAIKAKSVDLRSEGIFAGYSNIDQQEKLQPSLFDAPEVKEKPPTQYTYSADRTFNISELKPYSNTKDSGQLWLGKVPKHWQVLPNRALFAEINDRNHPNEQMLSITITRGIVQKKMMIADKSIKDSSRQDKTAYKLVRPNDIAYNKMRAWQGAIAASEHRGIISPAYVVQRLRKEMNLPRYYHYLFRTPNFAKEAERWSYGITSDMWSLRPEHFKVICSTEPPCSEQAVIVRFLDCATKRLDGIIQAKRKIVGLLNEQKQVVIHYAVTRGISSNLTLKSTDIPWLSEIPATWKVQKLGRVISLLTGFPFSSGGFAKGENGTRLVRGINVTPFGIRWDEEVCWKRSFGDSLEQYELRVGDIVLGMDRPIVSSGIRAAVICKKDVPSLLLQRVARLRPHCQLDAQYLLLLLCSRAFSEYMEPIFTGISVPHLSPEQINNFVIALPEISEQKKIVLKVRKETSQMNATIFRLENEINLLCEYRTRLISDIVTGKVDVRKVAMNSPSKILPNLDGAEFVGKYDTNYEEADT